jgi:hypothetical protein
MTGRWGWTGREAGGDESQRTTKILRRGEKEWTGSRKTRVGLAAEGNRTRHILLVLLYVSPLSGVFPFRTSLASRQRGTLFLSLGDGNFLSAARLTYFLPDVALKFHAIVVTICSKKLIEPEGAPGGSPAGKRGLSPRGASETFQSFSAVSCADEKHAAPVCFLS